MNVIIAGDFASKAGLAEKINEQKFSEIFPRNIREIIKSSDFSFVNLECPIIRNTYIPINKCGPNLGCRQEAIEAIKYAGFSGVTLANNHIFDYGKDGLYETVKCCKDAKLDIVGAGDNLKYAGDILYLEKDPKKLAIINCCEHEFSIATESDAGANPLNPIKQFYDIQLAKQKADYVLIIIHGGHEHYQLPSIRMQETYRFFIDAGADAVVNHHQHCYSGFEVYHDKPIFYGLGNFCFDESIKFPSSWYSGYLLELNFTENKVNYKLYPYEQCKDFIGVSLLIDRTEFDKDIDRLNSIIADSQKLQIAQDEYYSNAIKRIITMYQPYENRILNKLYRLHLLPSLVSKQKFLQIFNYINCEAHRDKQLFALKKIIEK